jgi:hypothetical protein
LSESPTSAITAFASNQGKKSVAGRHSWDYLIESAKGWADPYIADAYILFGRANIYILLGIGCLALLAVFEIIERSARRKKQHSLGRIREITSKQRKADQRKERARPLPRRKPV